jgi:hypothetical protein
MADAARKRDEGPRSNKAIIERFRDEYKAGMEEAKIAEDLTNTDGWRSVYRAHFDTIKSTRREQAKRLKMYAERLDSTTLTEDDEKDVKDLMKASASLRDRMAAFQFDTVVPATKCVGALEKIRERFKREAEVIEENDPLHSIGLADLMKAEIRRVPWPTFDPESGVVTVGLPKEV